MLSAADELELILALDVPATITAVGLTVGALAGAYATALTARRAGKSAAAPAPPPPAPATDDELLTARMWFEMLARCDAMATDLEAARQRNLELERRNDAVEAERLELLRRLAAGELGA